MAEWLRTGTPNLLFSSSRLFWKVRTVVLLEQDFSLRATVAKDVLILTNQIFPPLMESYISGFSDRMRNRYTVTAIKIIDEAITSQCD